MKKLKITGKALQWLEDYLSNRKQYVEMDHHKQNNIILFKSSLRTVKRGVPQGSILGPLLFLIYINDFPKEIDTGNKCILFADDTTILVPYNKQDIANNVIDPTLDEATNTFNRLHLTINKQKTIHVKFQPVNNSPEAINNSQITVATYTKFLGIIIDNNLTWHPHIDQLSKKLLSVVYVIRRLSNISGERAAFVAYHALFASHLRYGIVAWGAASQVHLNRILVIQKKALRIILGVSMMEHCRPLFKKHKLLTVVSLYILETTTLAKKANPSLRCNKHAYNTRNNKDIDLPMHRLKKIADSPAYAGAYLFNLLPSTLKVLEDNKLFATALRQYLTVRPYYTMTEFVQEHTFRHLAGRTVDRN